jgi:hypothetical protein
LEGVHHVTKGHAHADNRQGIKVKVKSNQMIGAYISHPQKDDSAQVFNSVYEPSFEFLQFLAMDLGGETTSINPASKLKIILLLKLELNGQFTVMS